MNTAFLVASSAMLLVALASIAWPLLGPHGPAAPPALPVMPALPSPTTGSAGAAQPTRGRERPRAGDRILATVLVLAIPSAVAALYLHLGQPERLGPPGAVPAGGGGQTAVQAGASSQEPPPDGALTAAQIEGMVARLAERMKSTPDDERGWRMLVKSYETMGRHEEAVGAYRELVRLVPGDPALLVDFAVTLGMARHQSLQGEPEHLLRQALALDPRHVQALALLGSAAFERGDHAGAVAAWEQVLAAAPEGSDIAASLQDSIAKARALQQRGAEAARR